MFAEFQLLLPHKWSEAMGLDELIAKKNWWTSYLQIGKVVVGVDVIEVLVMA
jgi:hypothetical protein